MKISFFSTKSYDREFFERANQNFGHELVFYSSKLNFETRDIIKDSPCVCVFVNDTLDQEVLTALANNGVSLIALRCAGFNNVDVRAAYELGMSVVRVPAYSPNAVAEHAVGLMLALNRKIHRSYSRVRNCNFSLQGLLGFDMAGKTAGIIGTGRIGQIVARILKQGMGMKVIAHDPKPCPECESMGVEYVDLTTLYSDSDIISLHCPLTHDTHHLINTEALSLMKDGVMIVNTSRGAVIDTCAVIEMLKSGKVGYLGLDVYEQEGDLFFEDLSDKVITDDVFERLLTFPNVLITGHQGFFTEDALRAIADTTLQNVTSCENGKPCENLVTPDMVVNK